MWRRHTDSHIPSRHAVRATCMQLLPLVEMYCKWSLDEDCTNLHALMLRFDSEAELESHDLGRSLLLLVRDDALQTDILPQCIPLTAPVNPFDVFRERLSAAALAIRGMHHQVDILLCVLRAWGILIAFTCRSKCRSN